MSEATQSLYERVGGEPAVARMVFDFYRRVFADPLLSPFFQGIEADRLQTMQREFFSAALDGPVRYTGCPMRQVHAGLGIELRHLRAFLDHLMETLEGSGLSEQDRYDIHSRIHTYADEITGRIAPDG